MVRHKNRYIVVEINEDSKKNSDPLVLRGSSFYQTVLDAVKKLHGDFGVAAILAAFAAKYCNEKTRIAIIRCRHGPHKLIASSLPFIQSIEGKKITVNTLYIGATIKQCFKFVQQYQQRKFDEYCVSLKTDEEKEVLKKALLDMEPLLSLR